jgi:hypothetical protein
MRATHIRPTGIERTFGTDEIIVTKTDPRGIITYANEVFLRISALTEAEAVGQPHNVIRHGRHVGYHSNRRRPETSAIAAVRRVYDRVRTAESRAGSTPAAVEAGWRALEDELGDRTYDEFVWAVTNG